MSTKEKVINILNILPENVIESLYDYAQYLAERNEEYLTEDEIKSLDKAREDMENGIYYTHEEVWD